jgi:hypothetical protein
MYHSINAGRLRDLVELFVPNTDTDIYGQVTGKTLVFDSYAEVKTVSGNKILDYGTSMTSTIITVLMWFDERADNNQILLFNGVQYQVNHIKPDELCKSMILTCEVIKK